MSSCCRFLSPCFSAGHQTSAKSAERPMKVGSASRFTSKLCWVPAFFSVCYTSVCRPLWSKNTCMCLTYCVILSGPLYVVCCPGLLWPMHACSRLSTHMPACHPRLSAPTQQAVYVRVCVHARVRVRSRSHVRERACACVLACLPACVRRITCTLSFSCNSGS